MSKVGKKTLLARSTWDSGRRRVRPLGLLCGQKSHFHHVPKDQLSPKQYLNLHGPWEIPPIAPVLAGSHKAVDR